ncbi:MAG: sulfatase-like hydrolase/transferase [bacterium]
MKRRKFLKITTQGAGLAFLGSVTTFKLNARPQRMPDRKTNILYIMVDQQQWGTIANRSECRTPNINRLTQEGILFNRAYTPSAVCCPARAMLLTGAYHWHNGVFNQVHSAPSVHRDMFPNVVTYSQRMKEAGYRLGYVGKWHASFTRTPLDFGFDEIAAPRSYNKKLLKGLKIVDEGKPRQKGKRIPVRNFQWPGSQPFPMWGYDESPEDDTQMFHIAESGINMIQRFSQGDKPWHIEIHFPQPHDPYMPLREYRQRYDATSIPVPRSFYDTFEGKPGMHRRESESWGKVTEEDYQESRAFYYAYCEQLDAQIGRILDALDKTGYSERTMVLLTTDHGDMVGAHRMWIKGWIPYEECYRIPMVIRWPGIIKPGSVSNHLVQLHDIAHTYMDVLDLPTLPFEDGRSLVPLFENPNRSDWSDEILCAYYGGEFLYTQRMVITDRYKYVFNGFDYDECYDLLEDPQEMHNRVHDPAYREVVDDLRARLYELMNKFEDPFGDVPIKNSIGQPPNRYGAPRYLPRGKRIG